VAAVLGLTAAVLALVFPAVVHIRQFVHRTACQDGMRMFYQAAAEYSDEHDGRFPRVADGQTAASVADSLKTAGYLPADVQFSCPAGRPAEAGSVALVNYAYTLGFRDEQGDLQAVARTGENDQLPILADAPTRRGAEAVPVNHRHGQNVLFAGGHVRFCTTPTVGVNGDDIFWNHNRQVGAGLSPTDAALGRPEERP
jgi:prepilin-type processing-associated H-X9-DG protein